MGAAMSNEMDQSDSWFESFEVEIVSMTLQQQEGAPPPIGIEPACWDGAPPPISIEPACWDGAPPPIGIEPACWDGPPPPVDIGLACWDPIPLRAMLNEMDQSGSSSESSVTPQQQQPIPNPRPMPPKRPPPVWLPKPEAPPVVMAPAPFHGHIGDGDERSGICISRVVHTIRNIKPDVYTPKFVSIGPIHHGNKWLQDMERRKKVLLKRFIQRSGINSDVWNIFIKSLALEGHASYSKDINYLSKEELVNLILVDAAFIIELFLSFWPDDRGKEISANDSTIMSQLALLGTLPLDLVLFENQLPFLVLKKIFDKAFPDDLCDNALTFPKLACHYFKEAFGLEMPKHDPDNDGSIKHFTDLVRFLLLQRAPPPPMTMEPYSWTTNKLLYSAKELQELGVKFKVSKSKSILDIRFSDPVLELPRLLVAYPVTDALFSNMVAFEQLHCTTTSFITNYVTLWSDLIKTEEDVHVLVDKKIIRSFVPDTEVVTLFRSMGKGGFQAVMIFEYIDIFMRLNKFYENRCHQHIASLKRDYCRTPWKVMASVAAGCLVILALLQTIFTIKK